jgi:GNAT superfamily N-acetyltransferase
VTGVRRATPTDTDAVVAVVAAAFADYPHGVWVEPDRDARGAAVRAFYGADLPPLVALGATDVVEHDGRVAAAAVWCRSTDLAGDWGADALGVLAPPVAARLATALALMQAHAPVEPHWYLDVLAVDPARQGAGLGTRAVAAGLARADAEGVPCYLETARSANLPLYHRLGFETVSTASLDDLRVWGLWRPARPFVSPGTSLV